MPAYLNTDESCVRHFGVAAIAFLCIAFAPPHVIAEESITHTPEELHKHFQNVAEAYQMDTGGVRLTLRKQPLMHWQNTVRRQEQGALYLWEKNGRPQVLGSIFTFQMDGKARCRHEMISLAGAALTSKLDSTTVWSPKKAGVTWTACDGVPPPTESGPRRMTQMRLIARQFSGTLNIPERQPANLTLIPQPMVRYDAPGEGVIDGAVFSLAVVTDPEILLMIEARTSKSGSPSWHYAAARAHYHELKLSRNHQTVWERPAVLELSNTQAGQLPFAKEPYFIFWPPNPLPAPEELR